MDLFAPGHLFLILIVVLLLFGGKKIPELMKGLGRGVREFNDAKTNAFKEPEVDAEKPLHPVNGTLPAEAKV